MASLSVGPNCDPGGIVRRPAKALAGGWPFHGRRFNPLGACRGRNPICRNGLVGADGGGQLGRAWTRQHARLGAAVETDGARESLCDWPNEPVCRHLRHPGADSRSGALAGFPRPDRRRALTCPVWPDVELDRFCARTVDPDRSEPSDRPACNPARHSGGGR